MTRLLQESAKVATLVGGDHDDFLIGYESDDTLTGGKGNDKLRGDKGDDHYYFAIGDGADQIDDSNGSDHIYFADGVSEAQVSLRKDASNNLIIRINNNDSITVLNAFNTAGELTAQAIENIHFSDTSVWNLARIQTELAKDQSHIFTGTTGDDQLVGDNASQTFIGNQGDDQLNGGSASDVYQYALGDGNDVITDINGNDRLELLAGINESEVVARRDGDDLVLTMKDGASITIQNTFGAKAANVVNPVITTLIEQLQSHWMSQAEILIEQHYGLTGSGDITLGFEDGVEGAEAAHVEDGTVLKLVIDLSDFSNPPNGMSPYYYDRIIAHEMVHAVMMRNMDLSDLPGWFTEGTAEFIHGADERVKDDANIIGLESNFIQLFKTTVGSPSTSAGYSVSYIAVKLLDKEIRNHGGVGIKEVFDHLKTGKTLDQALIAVSAAHTGLTAVWNNLSTFETHFKTVGFAQYTQLLNLDDLDTGSIAGSDYGNAPQSANAVLPEGITGPSKNFNLVIPEQYVPTPEIRGLLETIGFTSGAQWDQARINQEVLKPTNGNDIIHAFNTNDTLSGAKGNDQLFGYDGNDVYRYVSGDGSDVIVDSAGTDQIEFGVDILAADIKLKRDRGNNLVITLKDKSTITVKDAFDASGKLSAGAVESIKFLSGGVWDGAKIEETSKIDESIIGGTNFNDTLIGTSANDVLVAGLGDDYVNGVSGNDIFIGGLGNDELLGGSGIDTYEFNLGDGKDIIYEEGGNENPDVIVFGEGISENNIKIGRNQNDLVLLIGELGDQITIRSYYAGYSEGFNNRNFDLQFVDGVVDLKDLHNRGVIDTFFATEGDDTLRGTLGNDRIDALMGNDYIITGFGNDTLIGGLGNDYLGGGESVDTYLFNIGDGHDTVEDLPSYSNEFNHIVFGDEVDRDSISFGRSRNDLVMFYGNQTDKIMVPGFFNPGYSQNNNSYFVSFQKSQENPVTLQNLFEISNKHILTPTTGNDDIAGFESDDVIHGLNGDDYLYGERGNDTLIGGLGSDRLFGGSGFNTYVFNSNDGMGGDGIELEAFSEGKIVFGDGISVDDLTFTYNGDYGIKYGNSSIYFYENKLLFSNWEIEFSDAKFNLAELLGNSSVVSSERILGWNNKGYAGTSWNDIIYSANGTGNDYGFSNIWSYEGNDSLVGSIYNDALYAGADNDTLNGGLGDDTLVGDTGNDTYLYKFGSGSDVIIDSLGIDRVEFGAGILPGDVAVTRSNSSTSSADGKGTDLVFTFTNGQSLKIKDVFLLNSGTVKDNNVVEEFRFTNDTYWTFEQAVHSIAGADLIAPQQPSASFSSSGAVIQGVAETGSLVEAKSTTGIVLGSAIANATTGTYSISLQTPLINYETVNVTAKDAPGNVSTINVIRAPDYTAPAAPDGTFFPDPGKYISGTAEVGSYVEARSTTGELLGRSDVITAVDGAYSITFPTKLINGESINLTAIDTAGNISSVKTLVAPDTVAPLQPSAAFDLTGKIITGTAEAGSTVIVKNTSGVELRNAVADSITGAYSITLTTALINNEIVNVTANDTSGNVSVVNSIKAPDLTAPLVPTANFDTAGKVISGVAEAGSVVVVKNVNNTSTLGTVTAHATTGAYSITLVSALINKETVNITATDVTGNVSVARTLVAPDGSAPNPISLVIQAENYTSMSGVQKESTSDAGGGQNAGYIDAGDWMAYNNAAFNVPAEGRYRVTYRVASLNGGGRITLKELSTDAALGSIMVPKTSGWQNWVDVTQEITLSSGDHNFKLAADIGGFNINWFKLEPLAPVVSDTTPPSQPTAVFDPNGMRISGIAEVGSVVIVKDSSNANTLGTVTTDATTGAYSITLVTALINKETVNVTAKDAAGNTSAIKAIIAPDKTAPALPTANFDTAGKVISGTAEAASVVVVKNASNTNTLGTVTAHATTGAYSITLVTALTNNETVNITAADSVGNVSAARALIAPGATTPNPASIVIQAENYTSMSGVQKESTSDVGGGQNAGYIDAGDWMAYNNAAFNVPVEGRYRVTYRVASLNGGGRLTLKELSTDAALGSITVPKTGTWQTWVDVTQEITLSGGVHNFKLAADVGGFNINWLKLESLGPTASATTTLAKSTEMIDWQDKVITEIAGAGNIVKDANNTGSLGTVTADAIKGVYDPAVIVEEVIRLKTDYESVHYVSSNDALIQAMASFVSGSGVDTRYRSTQVEQGPVLIAVGS